MPRNAAGVYSLPNPPVVSGNTIESADENDTRDDVGAEITSSLDRSGRGGMLAPLRLYDGTEALPGLAWTSDLDSGLYRVSANQIAMSAGGVDAMRWNTATTAVNAIDVFPAATTAAPYMIPFGSDANIGLNLRGKGTGNVSIADGTDVTKVGAFNASAITTATTRTFTFPDANIKLAGHATGLTSTRIPYASGATGGVLTDSANLTFSGTVLTALNLTVTTQLINSALTVGRIPLVGASGLLTDSASFTYQDTAADRTLDISASASATAQLGVNNTHASGTAFLAASTSGSGRAVLSASSDTGDVFSLYTTNGVSYYAGIDESLARYAIGGGASIPTPASDHLRIDLSTGRLHVQPNISNTDGGSADAGIAMGAGTSPGIFFGTNAPTFTAIKGSLYLRANGSTTNNRAYINTDGGTTWTAVTTVA